MSMCFFFSFFFLGERLSIALIVVRVALEFRRWGIKSQLSVVLDDLEQVMQSSAEPSFEI